MNATAQKRPGGDHDGPRREAAAIRRLDTGDLVGVQNEARNRALGDIERGQLLEQGADGAAVQRAIALRARCPDGWSLGSIEHAELDGGAVGRSPHDAAQRVDLAHQVSLRDPAHCRVARHLRDQIDVERVESSLQAHAGGGHRGFASGMTGSDYDHIELFGKLHGKLAEPQKILTLVPSFILAIWRLS